MRNKIIIFGALLAFGLSLVQTANCGTKGQKTGSVLPSIEKSYDAALFAAKKDHKYIFLLFSGLTWDQTSRKLHNQVVNTKEFAEYANKNLHTMIVDLPRDGWPKVKSHIKLFQKYPVYDYFPTVIIFDPDGKVVDTMVGLEAATPQQMIAWIESTKKVSRNADLNPEEDYDAALSAAKKDRKYVFLLFSGLDWGPLCKRLHNLVVNTKKFAEYADKNLHVIVVDVPRNKKPKAQHLKLLQKYSVKIFPTAFIIDPDGEVVDAVEPGTSRELIALIESAKKVPENSDLNLEKDYDAVLSAAKKDRKYVFLLFSGLDWCPPCKRLHNLVVNTKKFAEYADKNLHVVIVDVPRNDPPKPQHLKLLQKYSVRSFPTLLMINPDGKVVDTMVGLEVETPQELIALIESAKKVPENLDLNPEEDYNAALSAAKKDRKYVFLLFSGLDWCSPCKRLHNLVVNTKKFAEYADKNLHVVIVDVLRNGSPKNKSHRKLLQEYSVHSFPTLLIINPDGKDVDTMVGLEVRTPRQMIARIESVK